MNKNLRLSLEIGSASSFLCWMIHRCTSVPRQDFWWAIAMAQNLLARRDPYSNHFGNEAVPYPLPAALWGLPFVHLPISIGSVLFFGVSTGILAYGLLKTGRWRLSLFLAFPFFAAMFTTQWSPLITAAAYFPAVFPVILAKPNIGIPVGLIYWSRKGLWCAGIVAVLSLCIEPNWPFRWWSQIGGYQGFIPLFTLPGPLLLCAIPRIKTKSAQLLLLSSLMPQRWFYDPLILWLIPKTIGQMLWASLISWLALAGWLLLPHTAKMVGVTTVVFVYLPMLAVVFSDKIFFVWGGLLKTIEKSPVHGKPNPK